MQYTVSRGGTTEELPFRKVGGAWELGYQTVGRLNVQEGLINFHEPPLPIYTLIQNVYALYSMCKGIRFFTTLYSAGSDRIMRMCHSEL